MYKLFFQTLLSVVMLLLLLPKSDGLAQASIDSADERVVVRKIWYEGDKITKNRIISRELSFKEGDTLGVAGLSERLRRDRNKVFNLELFVTADIEVIPVEDGVIDVLVRVKEQWYFFPMPIFELSDRNFNEWVKQYDADFSRTLYGIRFKQKNFRGRNEVLKAVLQFGFTRKYELFYNIPYIDKKQRQGLDLGVSYSTNQSVAFRTVENQLDFVETDGTLRERFYAQMGYVYRNRFYITHIGTVKYHYNKVGDTVAVLNPRYMLDSRTSQRYLELSYFFTDDHRDIRQYAQKGHHLALGISALGLGIFDDLNLYSLTGTAAKYYTLGHGFFAAGRLTGKASLPTRQPYFNQQGLGYGTAFVRGYEQYVMDGQFYLLERSSLRYQLFETKVNAEKFIPIRQFNTIPIAMYLKTYLDAGRVWDFEHIEGNERFANRTLIGGGLGVDFVTFYSNVIRLEYSINGSGEHGFFLHFKTDI